MSSTPATSLTLVTSGLQDARLIPPRGNPDIHQFINVVRKTTRWAAQWNRVDFDGAPAFGQRVSMTLPRIGELITGFTLVVTMPDIYTIQAAAKQKAGNNFLGPTYGWTNSLGHSLIQLIELEIGGVIVEQFDSVLLETLDELYETVEATVTKNAMIKRAPTGFGPTTFQGTATTPVTVYVPIPFWWSKPGVYSHALPIQALTADIVRIHVTFRPVSQLFYTDARVNPNTVGFRKTVDISGGMWAIEGGRFWQAKTSATTKVYNMNATMPQTGLSGELIPNITFPNKLFIQDAYALIEYISLEEAEAIPFRTAELTYQVEQHLQVPVVNTLGTQVVRVNLPYANPVKEVLWVAQRPEAGTYNATFLFTRDLAAYTTTNPCQIPWWPDAQPIPSQATNWQVVPAFQQSYSEPIQGASLLYNNIDRFVHDGASYFRGLVPALSYVKSAIYNRYVYAYNFGQKEERLLYEVKGAANWDKIQRKELYVTMNRGINFTSPPNMNLMVYITVWNVFKVFGGRGGMLFTN
jgi:hypothetical protein